VQARGHHVVQRIVRNATGRCEDKEEEEINEAIIDQKYLINSKSRGLIRLDRHNLR
jgi:hypothetical protein